MSGKKSSYINAQICNITSPHSGCTQITYLLLTVLSELSALKLEANAFEIRKKISCLKPFLGMRSASFQVCESRSQSKLIALFAHSNFFFFFFLIILRVNLFLIFPAGYRRTFVSTRSILLSSVAGTTGKVLKRTLKVSNGGYTHLSLCETHFFPQVLTANRFFQFPSISGTA